MQSQNMAFFEQSYPQTHIFHVHNAIIACLTQLLMDFDGFHATQVEESYNDGLFFKWKRRHFTITNTAGIRHVASIQRGRTVLPVCFLQHVSRFYLLPFPRKNK